MTSVARGMAFLITCIALAGQDGNTNRADVVSPRAVRECATCHAAQARPHPASSMAHAMELPAECSVLQAHPTLSLKSGSYTYRIERHDERSIYLVSDGRDTLRVPIGWAFGLGLAGQTYVYEYGGEFYQSRVSFYNVIDGLDMTLGAQNSRPANLVQAAGQLMSPKDQVQCFGCHATGAVEQKKLTLGEMVPGVQCERCHGPTSGHLEAVKHGDVNRATMPHLGAFTTEQMANFCGQCHRTWDEIASSGITGVLNVRFQPYRLINSKCYDADDVRIRCTTCHDPHREVNRSDIAYDQNCHACHGGGKPEARACKVSGDHCVSCHMPKVEVPGSHFKFTDHQIRIARASAPYPG